MIAKAAGGSSSGGFSLCNFAGLDYFIRAAVSMAIISVPGGLTPAERAAI